MAVNNTTFSTWDVGVAIRRNNPSPLDSTENQISKTNLEKYAQTGATAYVGQIAKVIEDGVVTGCYIIKNKDGELLELSTKDQLNNAITSIPKGIPTLTIPDSIAVQELAPNVLYIFSTRTSTLTLTLGTPIDGIANEYHFFLVCGSTAPTINFPTGITWNGENAPEIAANKKYEVSILNNIAAYFEV